MEEWQNLNNLVSFQQTGHLKETFHKLIKKFKVNTFQRSSLRIPFAVFVS